MAADEAATSAEPSAAVEAAAAGAEAASASKTDAATAEAADEAAASASKTDAAAAEAADQAMPSPTWPAVALGPAAAAAGAGQEGERRVLGGDSHPGGPRPLPQRAWPEVRQVLPLLDNFQCVERALCLVHSKCLMSWLSV